MHIVGKSVCFIRKRPNELYMFLKFYEFFLTACQSELMFLNYLIARQDENKNKVFLKHQNIEEKQYWTANVNKNTVFTR